MGLWSTIGAIGGGVGGFLVGGPVGAAAGAAGGYGLGASADASSESSDAAQRAAEAAGGVGVPKMDRSAFQLPDGSWAMAGPSQEQTDAAAARDAAQATYDQRLQAYQSYKQSKVQELASALQKMNPDVSPENALAQAERTWTTKYEPNDEQFKATKQREAEAKAAWSQWGTLQQRDSSDPYQFAQAAKAAQSVTAPTLERTSIDYSGAQPYEANAAAARDQQTGITGTMLDVAQDQRQGTIADQLGTSESQMGAQQQGALAAGMTADQATAAGQSGLVRRLENDVSGKGLSLAEAQLARTTQRNIAQQQAMAASAGPMDAGAARRAAIMAGATTQQDALQQAAILRAQEYAQARGELANALSTQRQQGQAILGTQLNALQGIRNQNQSGAQTQAGIVNQQQTTQLGALDKAAGNVGSMRTQDIGQAQSAYTNATNQAQLAADQNKTQLAAEEAQRKLNAQREGTYLNAYTGAQQMGANLATSYELQNAQNKLTAQGQWGNMVSGATNAAMQDAASQRQMGAAAIGAAGTIGAGYLASQKNSANAGG